MITGTQTTINGVPVGPVRWDPPRFADVAANPPRLRALKNGGVMIANTALPGGWFARWHADDLGRPVLRALYQWDER